MAHISMRSISFDSYLSGHLDIDCTSTRYKWYQARTGVLWSSSYTSGVSELPLSSRLCLCRHLVLAITGIRVVVAPSTIGCGPSFEKGNKPPLLCSLGWIFINHM